MTRTYAPVSSNAEAVRSPALHRIPSLDGLRAISILMVVGLHTWQGLGSPKPVPAAWLAIVNGGLGVRIFFVISGYLITRLLLEEQRSRGSVQLRGFFVKRVFRIVPPVLLYVAVLAVLALCGRVLLTRSDALSALLFFRDYAPAAPGWTLDHFWSLSVEEQFYLFWPPVLVLCLRRGTGAGALLAGRIAVVMLVVTPVLRALCLLSHNPLLHNGYGLHTNMDLLMFGCAAALLERRAAFERVYRRAAAHLWIVCAVLLLSSYLDLRYQNRWNFTLGTTVTGVCITTLLLWCMRNADSRVGRLLNTGAMVRLGVISYGVYLWQTIFLHQGSEAIFRPATWLARAPASWLAILLMAELSYRLVEQPAVRLRHALLRRWAVYGAAPRPAMGQLARAEAGD